MTDLRTVYRYIHPLASFLLVGLVFTISPVLAGSVNDPASVGSTPCSQEMVVKADDIRAALGHEGGEINCSGFTIEGDLNLFEIPAQTDIETGEKAIIIKRPLTFHNAVFKGSIQTSNQSIAPGEQPKVKFLSNIDFIGTHFEGDVNFDYSIFQEDANFGEAHFQKMISFTDAKFIKYAGFRSAQFDERALFTRTLFNGETDFAIATFNWLAFFLESEFNYSNPSGNGANFLYTRFNGDTIFAKAHFKSVARFVGTRFSGPTYFAYSTFEDQVWFAGGVQFDKDVTFKGAKFNKSGSIGKRAPVLFSGVVFSGNAIFSDVNFSQVDFVEVGTGADIGMDTIFRKEADFRGATFNTLNLTRVIFQEEVDFSRAKLGEKIDFTDMDIEKASVQIGWDQLLYENRTPKFAWQGAFKDGKLNGTDHRIQDDFFRFLSSLERNFQIREQLGDAGNVHYLMEDLKSSTKGALERIMNTFFLKYIYGYGVKPWNQVLVSLLIIIGFAFVYTPQNVLQYDQTRKRKLPFGIFDMPIDWSGEKEVPVDSSTEIVQPKSVLYRYWQGFWFSLYVFTKIGYGGVYVRDKYKYTVTVEWIIGLFLWVAFLYNLSNTVPLLYRLVTMLH